MKKFLLLLILPALYCGCSTDFDVIAPYKEVIVIDGLINAVDTVQYVKVSKAFLGEGNALTMAQQSDSINYADVLDVKMERILNGQVLQTFPLTRTESNDKDSGAFAYPFHVLYKMTNPIVQSDDSKYRITVTNTQTGVIATSITNIVRDLNLSPQIPPTINMSGAAPQIVTFIPGRYAEIYDMILRFNYREIDSVTGNSTEHHVDWQISPTVTIQQEIKFVFYKNDFFRIVGDNIPNNPGTRLRVDSLSGVLKPFQFILLEGSEDLQTYMELQKPASGIVQERPTFTTVENGLGLFTSRIIHYEFRDMAVATQTAFDTSVYTRNLPFDF